MKKNIIFLAICLSLTQNLLGQIRDFSHLIILFIYPMSSLNKENIETVTIGKPTPSHKIADSFLQYALGTTVYSGIYATYAGFVTISDHNGQIRFPRKHQEEVIYILVTPKIDPIFMSGKTISHYEIDLASKAALYKISIKKDLKTKEKYWLTEKMPLPADRIIPKTALVLFAKPSQIYIPVGKSPALNTDAQLLLPKIYATDKITINLNALYVLNIRQFFAPLKPVYKAEALEISSKLTY